MQVQKRIPVDKAIEVVTNYLDINPEADKCSAKPSIWIINELILRCEEDGTITYNKASAMLDEARTSKCFGGANKNINYYRQYWKKLYL